MKNGTNFKLLAITGQVIASLQELRVVVTVVFCAIFSVSRVPLAADRKENRPKCIRDAFTDLN